MSLADAIAELRALDHDVSEEVVSSDLQKALEAHDAVHVLFGCDISDDDEILAHVWMALGTDVSMSEMHNAATDRDHVRYAKGFAHGRRIMTVLKNVHRIALTASRALRMRKRWPFSQYQQFLDESLLELRRDYGIIISDHKQRSEIRRGPHHPPTTTAPA